MTEPQCIVIAGDCRAVLPTLPEKHFRACVTSVPYWMQREYLHEDHPQKHLEIGRESTPHEYVHALVQVFSQVRRVLTDDGTLWINIGDKFVLESAQTPGGGGMHERLLKKGAIHKRPVRTLPGLRPKNLMGLPWRLAFALQDDGWFLRMDNVWDKPNALPSSAKDRPTLAHEYVFLLSKKARYFYNQDAVREPYATPERVGRPVSSTSFKGQRAIRAGGRISAHDYDKGGRNMRSVWRIAAGGGR
jgi:DNA modification methylase